MYPPEARAARAEGMVVLNATIGTDGLVQSLAVVVHNQLFDQAAVDAVKQWEYRPFLRDGQPVVVDTTIRFASAWDSKEFSRQIDLGRHMSAR